MEGVYASYGGGPCIIWRGSVHHMEGVRASYGGGRVVVELDEHQQRRMRHSFVVLLVEKLSDSCHMPSSSHVVPCGYCPGDST